MSYVKKTKRSDCSCMPEIPNEIIAIIFTFIPNDTSNWMNTMLVCKRFLSIGSIIFSPASEDNRYLINACRSGDYRLVKLLLRDARVNPSARHNTPFFSSISNGYHEITSLLLSDRRMTSPQLDTINPFYYIPDCSEKQMITTRLLLNSGKVDPSEHGNIALHWTLLAKKYNIAKELLRNEKVKNSIDPIKYICAYPLTPELQSIFIQCFVNQIAIT